MTFSFSELEQKFLWFTFFLAFASKVPMIPVHLWLPEAHVEAECKLENKIILVIHDKNSLIFIEKVQSLSCCCWWVDKKKHVIIRFIHIVLFWDKAASWKRVIWATNPNHRIWRSVRTSMYPINELRFSIFSLIKIYNPARTKYNSNLNFINFKTFFIINRKQNLLFLIKSSKVWNFTICRKFCMKPNKD